MSSSKKIISLRHFLYLILFLLVTSIAFGLFYLFSTGLLHVDLGGSYLAKNSAHLLKPQDNIIAFENVSIVSMEDEKVAVNQTVIVRHGKIEGISEANETDIPEKTLVIDGRGKYLMPGLADMHVHISEENDLLLLVANGVTTVRNMWGYTGMWKWLGFTDQLELRNKINNRELFGPTIYTAGPILDGSPPTTPFMTVIESPKGAEKAVAEQKEKGYDFIKVYDELNKESFNGIMQASKKHKIPVVGHVPKKVGLDVVLKSGQVSIEHLTGYVDNNAAEFIISEEELDDYAEKSRAANIWNSPTFVVWQKVVPTEKIEEMESKPDMKYISGRMKKIWRFFLKQMMGEVTYKGSDYNARIARLFREMIGKLHAKDARLILGTDAGNPYVLPGFSLHEELKYMVDSGLSPYDAIKAGTRDAAESLGKLSEFGTVTVGKRADLILVDENPLQSVANVKKIQGVMVRGLWFPKAKIDKMLEGLADSYR